jgi:hypothetical protein
VGPRADTKNTLKQAAALSRQARRRRLPMGINTGRRRPSSTGPSRRSNDGSRLKISDPTKRERTSKTWPSALSREIASSNLRKDFLFIWVSHRVRLAAGVPIGAL